MLLVRANEDGFGVRVGLLEETFDSLGDGFGAGAEGDDFFEVGRLGFPVWNRAAVAVKFTFRRPPSGGIHVGADAVHPIRREEAVFDALWQAVGVSRRAEILGAFAVVLAQRHGGHAELKGRAEPGEDSVPIAVVAEYREGTRPQ
ncbi:MAG: hypothetical protein N2652_02235 [Kiritimatiellae bacterium]|nr:hypothetical protein [Kiritimatiellia bacterium]